MFECLYSVNSFVKFLSMFFNVLVIQYVSQRIIIIFLRFILSMFR
jgi:hypothetical protein